MGPSGFNPRARVGRDARRARNRACTRRFNPRARVGRDAPCRSSTALPRRFNPRARVGRDDTDSTMIRSIRRCFNPRARVGRDLDGQRRMCRRTWFQSTRPRGARPGWRHARLSAIVFQSTRPRGARRQRRHRGRQACRVSIHAPAWGATPRMHRCRPVHAVSIHAPAWGATSVYNGAVAWIHGFNPRARVGRDMRPVPGTGDVGRFQSTRPRGARRV